MKDILITGTSTGIGFALAQTFARAGYQVFSVVRKRKDANRLKNECGDKVIPLIFDITDELAAKKNAQKVEKLIRGRGLIGIINNAGIAVSGPVTEVPLKEVRHQFEVNVLGHISVIQAFFPLLKKEKNSINWSRRIINISSFGGAIGIPYLGAYSASKQALEGFSTVLRREMRIYGIDVIIIRPAGTYTPIWDKDSAQNTGAYSSSDYIESGKVVQNYLLKVGKNGTNPTSMAEFIKKVFEKKNPKAIYSYLPGNRFNWLLTKIASPRLLDRILAFKFKLKPLKNKRRSDQ